MKKCFFVFLFAYCRWSTVDCFGQDPRLDSIQHALETAKEDTTRIAILNDLFLEYEYMDVKKAKECLDKALALAQKNKYKRGLGSVYLHLGFFAEDQGNYQEALRNYSLTLKYYQELGDQNGIASGYNNLAHVYTNMGNYPEALKNALASLKTDEAAGNKEGMASAYGNIAVIYGEQQNFQEALKNYAASLKISEAIGDKSGEASSYNNIGNIYTVEGNYTEALKNYFASLKIKKLIDDKRGQGSTYNNIGSVYCSLAEQESDKQLRLTKLEEGRKYCELSLEIREAIGDVAGVASSHSNLGMALMKLGNYAEAERHMKKAIEISKEIGYVENLKATFKELMVLDSTRGNYKAAYEDHKMYILYRDSLDNEDTRKRTIQNQMTYDFEKKEAVAQAEHKKELENQELLAEEKSRKQRVVLIFVLGSLLLVLIFAGFIFRSLRTTRKQKDIIERQKALVELQKREVELQKEIVEEHQKEIIDSITYARRIQQSLLPSLRYIDRSLKRLNQ